MISFPNVLCSYAYCYNSKQMTSTLCKLTSEANTRLLIDSGAYTAFKLGKPVVLQNYIDYIKLLNAHGGAWNTIQLDVIGDSEKTKRNLDTMYEQGVKPMPVLTVDMKSSESLNLIEYNKYICIAGGQKFWQGAKDWQWRRTLDVDKFTKGKALSHFLAFVRIPDLYKLPINSADASTWLAGQQYSRIACYISGGRMTGGTFYHKLRHLPKNKLNKDLIRHLNKDKITKTQWQDRELMSVGAGSYCSFKTVASFVALCNDARKRGKRIFLVVSGCGDLSTLASVCMNSDDKGYLNWAKAKKMFFELKALRKKSQTDWESMIVSIINKLNQGIEIENTNSS